MKCFINTVTDGSSSESVNEQYADSIAMVTKALDDVHLRSDHWVPQTAKKSAVGTIPTTGTACTEQCRPLYPVDRPNMPSNIGCAPPKPPRIRIPLKELPPMPNVNDIDARSQSSGNHSSYSSSSGKLPRYMYPAAQNGYSLSKPTNENSGTSSTGVFVSSCSDRSTSGTDKKTKQQANTITRWLISTQTDKRSMNGFVPYQRKSGFPEDCELMGDDLFLSLGKLELGWTNGTTGDIEELYVIRE